MVIRIGLIREGKNPPDKRVPFTPDQVLEIHQLFPEVKVMVEKSPIRCFPDQEYADFGIDVTENISDCQILMGIKEVPVQQLIDDKTYLFFSHTIKKQPYNRKLLQAVLEKRIKLVDYEALKDTQGNRLVAFGRYAGIVGAYNGLWAYGKKHKLFSLRRAFECFDVNDLKLELRKVKLPPVKIILTGTGRVARGAMETLDTAGIRKISPQDYLNKTFQEPVYVQLGSGDYHFRKEGGVFNRAEFHAQPDRYGSRFADFARGTSLLIAGAFWNPKAPLLFSRDEMCAPDFTIDTIADVTCDINGSLPSTIRASSIAEPVYDYDPKTGKEVALHSSKPSVTVMAIDNLPCELPRSASEEFGRDLIDRILKPLLTGDQDGIIARGTIADQGRLTQAFSYLEDYVSGT
ncbi:MAG: alanine dehydrogenase [Bacteroidetes bacterium]|nr:alanine dehydrogenase [Bacteroidota bacterium]